MPLNLCGSVVPLEYTITANPNTNFQYTVGACLLTKRM